MTCLLCNKFCEAMNIIVIGYSSILNSLLCSELYVNGIFLIFYLKEYCDYHYSDHKHKVQS